MHCPEQRRCGGYQNQWRRSKWGGGTREIPSSPSLSPGAAGLPFWLRPQQGRSPACQPAPWDGSPTVTPRASCPDSPTLQIGLQAQSISHGLGSQPREGREATWHPGRAPLHWAYARLQILGQHSPHPLPHRPKLGGGEPWVLLGTGPLAQFKISEQFWMVVCIARSAPRGWVRCGCPHRSTGAIRASPGLPSEPLPASGPPGSSAALCRPCGPLRRVSLREGEPWLGTHCLLGLVWIWADP